MCFHSEKHLAEQKPIWAEECKHFFFYIFIHHQVNMRSWHFYFRNIFPFWIRWPISLNDKALFSIYIFFLVCSNSFRCYYMMSLTSEVNLLTWGFLAITSNSFWLYQRANISLNRYLLNNQWYVYNEAYVIDSLTLANILPKWKNRKRVYEMTE